MVSINFARREIFLKIVYDGPPFSGKTRNLEVAYANARASRKGELTSISSEGDRTIFFGYVPLGLEVKGRPLHIQLYTVPGEVFCGATRKLAVQGADGIVFVADSRPERLESNIECLQDLEQNLKDHGLDPHAVPLVFEWNKRDVADALPREVLERNLNRFGAPAFEAVASRGEGVLPVLDKVIELAVAKILRESEQVGTAPPPA